MTTKDEELKRYVDKQGNSIYQQGYDKAKEDILKFIESERDNGNIEGEKGFSASLCLSKLIKMLQEKQ